jgi:N-carbamoyl-L-amino-acid hydrolase
MPIIDADRLLNDLKTLRSIGAVGTGVVRPALSEKDLEARRWLKKRFEDAGLDTTLDGVANVLGRSCKNGPALIVGSHSDTQPRGGWLDGALGVIYGLEVARALAEDPETSDLAIDVVSWQDEESRFYSCMGSRSWIGTLDPAVEATATDRDGVALTDALKDAGLTDVPRLRMEQGRYVGYLEAHIEQGAWLEDADEQIGIVTGIVGIRGMTLTFVGEQNHAGTTTMARRKDAATALFRVASRIHEEFPKYATPTTVWTIGRVEIQPGAASIVPGYAELTLQFRDSNEALLDTFEDIVAGLVAEVNEEGRIKVSAERSRTSIPPSKMDEDFQEHLALAAEKTSPGKWRRMPSAAGHDPMVLSEALPCAMVFIPSIGGISHDFAEDSHEEDIIAGCQVLADAAASILKNSRKERSRRHRTI